MITFIIETNVFREFKFGDNMVEIMLQMFLNG